MTDEQKKYHELEGMIELGMFEDKPIKKKKKNQPTRQYEYDSLWEYAMCYKDEIEESLHLIYKKEKIYNRFKVSFEQFVDKVNDAWKEYEINYGEYDKDYEYDYEEDEEEW